MKNKNLEEEIKKCRKCHLRDTCSQVVPGEGNPEAAIMFIGEAPGEKEDRARQAFVGAAGKFLEEMLALIEYEARRCVHRKCPQMPPSREP